MPAYQVKRFNDQRVFADQCVIANSIKSRFWGLMGREKLNQGEALWLEPCNSVHTFFMKFSIDVVYLDQQGKVLFIRRGMRPWRIDFPVFGASSVLELRAGAADGLSEGDLLCLS